MDALTSHFETTLNTWFQGFLERVSLSPVGSEGWVLDSLRALGTQKEMLARSLREGGLDSHGAHQALTRRANELMETVLVQEGPTAFAWLNAPLRSVERFLAGDSLAGGTADALEQAFVLVHDQGGSRSLREPLRQLMLWSQGHLSLSGLAVKGLLADCVSAARHGEGELSQQDHGLEVLLSLLQEAGVEERETLLDRFIEKLEQWEDELFSLEEEMAALGECTMETLTSTFESFSILKSEVETALEADQADWAGLQLLLAALRQEWEAASQIVNAALLRHGQESREDSYAHLDTLSQAVGTFQSGQLSCVELQSEVSAHQQRWSSVVEILYSEWSDSPGKLCLMNSIEQSLRALGTIASPGDARLGPVTQLYTGSLKSLLRQAA